MSAVQEQARLFVALELPVGIRTELERWQADAVVPLGGWRPVRGNSLHVTLCFLGWRATGEMGEIAAACSIVARRPPPELAVEAAIALPPRRPRALAVGLADPAGRLALIQHELSDRLAQGGWYVPERRAFLPHVTVARVRGAPTRRTVELPAPAPVSFTASRVVLYRSHLGRGGSRYEALATVELRGRG